MSTRAAGGEALRRDACTLCGAFSGCGPGAWLYRASFGEAARADLETAAPPALRGGVTAARAPLGVTRCGDAGAKPLIPGGSPHACRTSLGGPERRSGGGPARRPLSRKVAPGSPLSHGAGASPGAVLRANRANLFVGEGESGSST